jgi:hypothetical protein
VNDRVAPLGGVVQGAPQTAGNTPAGLRNMAELRARIHTLFCRIDQEMREHSRAHGLERTHGVERTHDAGYDPDVDRFWRGCAVQWSQRG